MDIRIETAHSPRWGDAGQRLIDLVVKFAHLEAEVPFTASATDPLPHSQALFAAAVAGEFGLIADYVAPAPTVPSAVSRFKARAALYQAGLLAPIEALMQDPATDMLARLAWQDAQEFRRGSPTVLAMAAALNLTAEQVDQLFISAAAIQA